MKTYLSKIPIGYLLKSTAVFFLHFVLLPTQVVAQMAIISDLESNNPIPNVAVFNNSKSSAISDKTGRVSLDIFKENDTLLFQHAGYMEALYVKTELKEMDYKVVLVKRILKLQEIVLSTSKFEEKRNDVPLQMDILIPEIAAAYEPATTADLLGSNGSIMIQKSQMGGGSPILRGFEANRIVLVVDGVRMNNAIYRSGHLQNAISIDNESLERVEVIFGPGAVIYGSDAMGGAVHFFTKKPRLATNNNKSYSKAATTIRYASATEEQTTHFDFNVGYRKIAFLTSITNSKFGNLAMGTVRRDKYSDFGKVFNYVVPNTNGLDTLIENTDPNIHLGVGYSQVGVMQKVLFKPSGIFEIELNTQYSTTSNIPRFDKLNDETGTGLKFAEWHYGPQDRFLGAMGLKITPVKSWFDKASVLFSYQKISEERVTRKFQNPLLVNRKELVDVYGANIDFHKEIDSLRNFQYGIEANYNNVASDAFVFNVLDSTRGYAATRYPDGGSTMQFYAGYLSYKWTLSPYALLNSGVRYSWVKSKADFFDTSTYKLPYSSLHNVSSAFNGSVGLVLGVEKAQLKAMLSTGFRAPNIDDLGKVFAKDEYVVVPNPGLVPEKLYSGELGVSSKLENGALNLDVTGFYSYLTDAIVRREYKLNGQDSLTYDGEMLKVLANTNISKAVIYGVSMGINSNWKQFKFNGTMTYTYGYDLEEGAPLSHIPPLFGKVSLSGSFNGPRWLQSVTLLAHSDFHDWKRLDQYGASTTDNLSEATEDGTPAWYTLNFSVSYALGMIERESIGTKFIPGYNGGNGIDIQFSVQNILDHHYKPFASGISGPGRNFIVSLRASLE